MGLLIEKGNKNGSLLISKEETNSKPTRYFSKKQESEVANTVGGSRTLNSGATPFQKGDVRTDQFLIECKTKTTPSESISIKKDWLAKNDQEALFMGKPYNALAFSFGPGESNYYIIDEYLFQYLVECLKDKSV